MRKHTPIQPAKNILEQTASNATYATDMECEENGFDTNEQSILNALVIKPTPSSRSTVKLMKNTIVKEEETKKSQQLLQETPQLSLLTGQQLHLQQPQTQLPQKSFIQCNLPDVTKTDTLNYFSTRPDNSYFPRGDTGLGERKNLNGHLPDDLAFEENSLCQMFSNSNVVNKNKRQNDPKQEINFLGIFKSQEQQFSLSGNTKRSELLSKPETDLTSEDSKVKIWDIKQESSCLEGGKYSRGLRNLSLMVKRIVEQKKTTTYKEVADILVSNMKEIYKTAAVDFDLQKDVQNIKRRVYDALNVLIASEVIAKKGKKVTTSDYTHFFGKCLNKKTWLRLKEVEKKYTLHKQRVRQMRTELNSLIDKYISLQHLVERNKLKECQDWFKLKSSQVSVSQFIDSNQPNGHRHSIAHPNNYSR